MPKDPGMALAQRPFSILNVIVAPPFFKLLFEGKMANPIPKVQLLHTVTLS